MKKRTIKNRLVSLILAIAMMLSATAVFTTSASAASANTEVQTKAEKLIKVLSDFSKTPMFKDSIYAYFGPCASILEMMLPEVEETSLDDISKKLDDINEKIQGRIIKEADRIIAAMDAIPDIIDVRNAKRNITSLKKSIENAQNNIGVDLESTDKTPEQKLREVAVELGDLPKDWGLGSTINGVEVLAEDITVKMSDIETAIATNSLDNLYVSMYRYQCTKSLLSGEAIDKSMDFVNTTLGIYLNSATTILQYLYAKKEVAIIDGDNDMIKKVDIKISSFLDDMDEAVEAYREFLSLDRLVFVGNESDAAKHIPLAKVIGCVNHKQDQVEDIDAVYKNSVLDYENVKNLVKKAKACGAADMKTFLQDAGFMISEEGRSYLIVSENYIEGGTVSVAYRYKYKGVDLKDAAFGETGVIYHSYRRDVDTLDVYDKRWYEGNAMYFTKAPAQTYVLTDISANSDFTGFTAALYCNETGEFLTIDNVKAVRTDNGEDPRSRVYEVRAYFNGRAYTGTKQFQVPKYQAANVDGKTVLTLNWGDYNNQSIDWTIAGGREAVNEVRIKKGVRFTGICTDMFNGLVNCEKIETENVETFNLFEVNGMFCGCSALKALDLSAFDTAQSLDFTEMFRGCGALEELNLANFTISNYRKVSGMFDGCGALAKLVLSARMNVVAEMNLSARDGSRRGWANENDPGNIITGKDRIAVFSGEGTYIRVIY